MGETQQVDEGLVTSQGPVGTGVDEYGHSEMLKYWRGLQNQHRHCQFPKSDVNLKEKTIQLRIEHWIFLFGASLSQLGARLFCALISLSIYISTTQTFT